MSGGDGGVGGGGGKRGGVEYVGMGMMMMGGV